MSLNLFMSRNKFLLLIFVLSLLLNFSFLYVLIQNRVSLNFLSSTASLQAKYPFLSRRAMNDNPNDLILNFLNLRNELTKQTAPYQNNFSAYFEYLPTGTSVGINSTQEFYAASLFKVPVIMAYYHKQERVGNINDEVLIIEKQDLDKNFGNLWKKGARTKIKASEAIFLALSRSDNTAAKVIARQVDEEDFQAVYQALDINFQTGSGGAITTTRDYSKSLKALYFASVINRDHSNQILMDLSKSSFNDKLVAGLPSGTLVAHKIGDYRDAKNNQAFYDCGLVYLPKRPYLLCMSSVGDQNTAKSRMKNFSKSVFDYVTSID